MVVSSWFNVLFFVVSLRYLLMCGRFKLVKHIAIRDNKSNQWSPVCYRIEFIYANYQLKYVSGFNDLQNPIINITLYLCLR